MNFVNFEATGSSRDRRADTPAAGWEDTCAALVESLSVGGVCPTDWVAQLVEQRTFKDLSGFRP